ncbi:MAG: toprim domain-containing protein, partial [Actinomycetota bacterium]
LGTAITPAHLRILSGYADRIYLLFDPDAAGEKATERAAASAADLKLDLRVLRLPQDPADWLLEHPAEEFVDLLSGAVPVLEYTIRRKTDGLRDAGTAERSRAVPEMRALISRIDDPVFRGEALRIASETLGVAPDVLDAGGVRRTAQRAVRSERHPVSDPWEQAGRQVLAVMLARPHIVARLLDEYVVATGTSGSFRLCAGDFRTEEQARIFRMLAERPGQDLDGLLSDERVRPFMDQLVALSAEAEKLLEEDLYASEGAIREAWLRLGILSRERRKRESEDLDLKERLHAEIRDLKEALRTVSIEP